MLRKIKQLSFDFGSDVKIESEPKSVRITSAELAKYPGEIESRRATEQAIKESLEEQRIATWKLITGIY